MLFGYVSLVAPSLVLKSCVGVFCLNLSYMLVRLSYIIVSLKLFVSFNRTEA
jgi:hypothetical protein